MKEVLEWIAQHLVDEPDEVRVEVVEGPRGQVLQLSVAEDDMGKVIGKRGRTARAIRSVMRAAGTHNDVSVQVEIVG